MDEQRGTNGGRGIIVRPDVSVQEAVTLLCEGLRHADRIDGWLSHVCDISVSVERQAIDVTSFDDANQTYMLGRASATMRIKVYVIDGCPLPQVCEETPIDISIGDGSRLRGSGMVMSVQIQASWDCVTTADVEIRLTGEFQIVGDDGWVVVVPRVAAPSPSPAPPGRRGIAIAGLGDD